MARKKALYTSRINTGVTKEQFAFLKKEAKRLNKGDGALIRDMFDYYMTNKK